MHADSLTAKGLFQKEVRYVIPTFQRPYVWTQDEQWEPFWDDVQHAADRYLEELDVLGDGEGEAVAEERAGRHFLGALVVKQQLNAAAELETREVIDGQQRMTTMQLLLEAAEEVADVEGFEDVAFELSRLTANDPFYARKDPDLGFKLWPTTTDREAFRAVMKAEGVAEHSHSQVAKAFEYFKLRIDDWLGQGAVDDRERRMKGLRTALMGLLEIVVIDLGSSDDAFVIFETLNARGTPLLASDLVKNYLLQVAASQEKLSSEEIAARYWTQFDSKFWRKEVRQGRLRRQRIDIFLDYWLEASMQREVRSYEVFPVFKELVDQQPANVLEVADDMQQAAEVYRELQTLDRYSRDGTFLYRWETIDARVLTPLLMWVFSWSPEKLDPERRTRLLRALESYLVRRMILRLSAKPYANLFMGALKRLEEAGPNQADDVMVDLLDGQSSEIQRWPTDDELQKGIMSLPLYKLLSRGRLKLVFEALEDDMRNPKSEDQHVTRQRLQIEHIMPQSWGGHWALPEEEDPALAGIERDKKVHTIGNLTLATGTLNRTMSNHGWETKREHLVENSTLHLNKRILQQVQSAGGWSDEQITIRSRKLAEDVARIFPRFM